MTTPANKWQPIETAPKDRTPILGYFGLTAGDDWADMAVVAFKKGEWLLCEPPFAAVDEPTHWMLLPEPPQ